LVQRLTDLTYRPHRLIIPWGLHCYKHEVGLFRPVNRLADLKSDVQSEHEQNH